MPGAKLAPSYMIDAKQKREIADYDVFLAIDPKTARDRVERAGEFLSKIKGRLKNA
jgi:CDP-diacylglycerol pyrophosphatase